MFEVPRFIVEHSTDDGWTPVGVILGCEQKDEALKHVAKAKEVAEANGIETNAFRLVEAKPIRVSRLSECCDAPLFVSPYDGELVAQCVKCYQAYGSELRHREMEP